MSEPATKRRRQGTSACPATPPRYVRPPIQEAPPAITTFPSDTLMALGHFLDAASLLSLAQTCTDLHSNQEFWIQLYLLHFSHWEACDCTFDPATKHDCPHCPSRSELKSLGGHAHQAYLDKWRSTRNTISPFVARLSVARGQSLEDVGCIVGGTHNDSRWRSITESEKNSIAYHGDDLLLKHNPRRYDVLSTGTGERRYVTVGELAEAVLGPRELREGQEILWEHYYYFDGFYELTPEIPSPPGLSRALNDKGRGGYGQYLVSVGAADSENKSFVQCHDQERPEPGVPLQTKCVGWGLAS